MTEEIAFMTNVGCNKTTQPSTLTKLLKGLWEYCTKTSEHSQNSLGLINA